MEQDKTALIEEVKALEAELEAAKQETKAAQERHETAKMLLLQARETAVSACTDDYQEKMAQITAIRKAMSQATFDYQQQRQQLRTDLANCHQQIYQQPPNTEQTPAHEGNPA